MGELGDEAVELCRALVRRPSVTPRDEGAQEVLAAYLRDAGFTVERVVFSEPGTPDIDNLFATIGVGAPHLAFAGHTDVVPPGDRALWSRDPFAGEIVGGEVVGRGVVDMKGGVAAFAAAAARFCARGPFKGAISFLITGDEEGPAINGTQKLLTFAAARGARFGHCLVGEPSNAQALGDMIKIGRRGSLNGTLTVAGRQGHVGYPRRADNPIPAAMRVASALLDPPLDSGTAHFEPSNLEIVSFDVGNPAFNVIPAQARARFNVRFNDAWTPQSLSAELEARASRAAGGARFSLDFEPCNALAFVTEPDAFTDLVRAAIARGVGRVPELSTSGGTSDARFIRAYCPVLEFGLVGQTMHMVDERAPAAEIGALAAIYLDVLEAYFA